MSERREPPATRPRWLALPDEPVRPPVWSTRSEGISLLFPPVDDVHEESSVDAPHPFGAGSTERGTALQDEAPEAFDEEGTGALAEPFEGSEPQDSGAFAVAPPAPPPGPDPELVAARAAFAEAAVALAAARPEFVAAQEPIVAQLALEIAEAILEDEVRERPELHRALARAALETIDLSVPARLRASRESYDAIVECFGGPRIEVAGRRVEVVLDAGLEGLGCIVDAGESRVDGRIRERIEAVRQAFAAARADVGDVEGAS